MRENKVIRTMVDGDHTATIVKGAMSGQYRYVSTNFLPWQDGGIYETMVFSCDKDGHVHDWSDLSCDRTYVLGESFEHHASRVNEEF